jgi:3-oxoacyl-[acyl-carrier-protein] synthase II
VSGAPFASVTGVGLVTALGPTVADTWRALAAGRCAIGALPRAIAGCQSGAPIADLLAPAGLRVPKHAKFMGRATLCGVRAALDAVAHAGLGARGLEPESIGVYTGTGETGLDVQEFFPALDHAWGADPSLDFRHLDGPASRLVDPYFSLRTLSNGAAALTAIELPARGPSVNFVQGATASAHALACACADLEEERVDAAVVIGCDSLLGTAAMLAYGREEMWSRQPPDQACQALPEHGGGWVPGEAGAAVVLERARDAAARGARRLGTVRGVGFAHSRPGAGPGTAPESDETQACARALAAAGGAAGTGAVIAPGDATPRGAGAELGCLGHTFRGAVPVTTLTGALGYVGAATSLVQLAVAVYSMVHGVPPAVRTVPRHQPASLDLVHGTPRPVQAGRAIACLARSFCAEHAAVVVAAAEA